MKSNDNLINGINFMQMQQWVEIISFLIVAASLFFLYRKTIKLFEDNEVLSRENIDLRGSLLKLQQSQNALLLKTIENNEEKDAVASKLKQVLALYSEEAGIEGRGNQFHAEMIEIIKDSKLFSQAEIFEFEQKHIEPYALKLECAKLITRLRY